jgi:hypothetical protein
VYEPSPFDDASRAAAIPAALATVGRRCLERTAVDRFPTADDLVEALERAQKTSGLGRRSAPRTSKTLTLGPDDLTPLTEGVGRRRAVRRAVWGLAGGAAVVGAYWAGQWRPVDSPPGARATVAAAVSAPGPPTAAPVTRAAEDSASRTTTVATMVATQPPPTHAPVRVATAAATPGLGAPDVAREPPRLAAPTNDAKIEPSPSIEAADGAKTRRSTVATLISTLRSGADVARAEAATTLGDMGADAAEAVPTLSAALRDRDGHVRSLAAQALGRIGLPARDAVPWLVDALKDKDERVRAAAAEALVPLSPAASPTVEALAVALKDDSPRVRAMAAYGLGHFPPASPKIVGALRKALKDDEMMVRRSAEAALIALGAMPAR